MPARVGMGRMVAHQGLMVSVEPDCSCTPLNRRGCTALLRFLSIGRAQAPISPKRYPESFRDVGRTESVSHRFRRRLPIRSQGE